MSLKAAHGVVHPHTRIAHVQAATISPDKWAETPDELPKCNEQSNRCEIWVPSAAFSLPTENEKRVASKNFGLQRGEEGWTYMRNEQASVPGWIVVRRKQVMRMPNE